MAVGVLTLVAVDSPSAVLGGPVDVDSVSSRLVSQVGSGDVPGSARAVRRGTLPVESTAGGQTFSIATLNVLGSQHTRGSTTRAPGRQRAATVAKLVVRKGIEVIGMQEVQRDQLRVLRRSLPDYDVWPAKGLGPGGIRLQIAWDRRVFAAASSGWIETPFDRQVRPVPWVELTNLASGRSIYVVNVHNSPRGLEEERDVATRQQLALIGQLRATRKAVFFVGDMNETREVFCKVAGRAGLDAANGGSATSRNDCAPPPGRMRIDWIFAAGPVSFTAYQTYVGRQVRSASDHPLVRAEVSIRPRS